MEVFKVLNQLVQFSILFARAIRELRNNVFPDFSFSTLDLLISCLLVFLFEIAIFSKNCYFDLYSLNFAPLAHFLLLLMHYLLLKLYKNYRY